MSEQISIMRALAQVKTVDARIAKQTAVLLPVCLAFGDDESPKLSQPVTRAEFVKGADAMWKSVNDLLEYRARLKAAIAKSNAETQLTLRYADKSMTMSVAEAIERKRCLFQRTEMLQRLKMVLAQTTEAMERHNASVEREATEVLKTTFGENHVVTGDEYAKVAQPLIDRKQAVLVDPSGIVGVVKSLESEIDAYDASLDIELNEKNATTMISVAPPEGEVVSVSG